MCRKIISNLKESIQATRFRSILNMIRSTRCFFQQIFPKSTLSVVLIYKAAAQTVKTQPFNTRNSTITVATRCATAPHEKFDMFLKIGWHIRKPATCRLQQEQGRGGGGEALGLTSIYPEIKSEKRFKHRAHEEDTCQ